MSAAVWERRFDTQLPLEADERRNILANLQATNIAPDIDYENNLFHRLLDGSPHLAPLAADAPLKQILHLGCGSGKWVAEMAAKYPEAQVVGVEHPSLGSQERYKGPNSRFEHNDIEANELWGENGFDFIYSRYVYPRVKDWNSYLANIYTSLTPGGWVELIEWDSLIGSDDGTLSPSSVAQQIWDAVNAKTRASGKDVDGDTGTNLVGKLEKLGFTNVETKASKVPHSPWPKNPQFKELGSYMFALTSLPILQQHLEYGIGLPHDQAKELATNAVEETKADKVHGYSQVRFFIAQKPRA